MSNDKTGLKSLAEGRSDVHRIDPRKLKIEPNWNQREAGPELDAHIDMLAQSIAEVGVRIPLKAVWRDGEAYIRSGHCRLAAALRAINHYKADVKTVPVMAEDRYASEADQILGQIIDNGGKPFSPIEQAKVFKRLVDFGWKGSDIASKAGISASRVSQLLDLNTLPEAVKQMVIAGEVSASMAAQTVKADPKNAEKQLKEAVTAAKAEGKERAMPKHTERGPSLKEQVKDVLLDSDIDKSGDIVIVQITHENFEIIRKLLKL